jgi:hypothetical protein
MASGIPAVFKDRSFLSMRPSADRMEQMDRSDGVTRVSHIPVDLR